MKERQKRFIALIKRMRLLFIIRMMLQLLMDKKRDKLKARV